MKTQQEKLENTIHKLSNLLKTVYHWNTNLNLCSSFEKYMPKPHSKDISNLKCYYSLLPHLNLLYQQKTEVTSLKDSRDPDTTCFETKAATKNTMSFTSQSNCKKTTKAALWVWVPWRRKGWHLIPPNTQRKVFSAPNFLPESQAVDKKSAWKIKSHTS